MLVNKRQVVRYREKTRIGEDGNWKLGVGDGVFMALGKAMRRTWEEEDWGEGLVAKGVGVWDVESLNGGDFA